MLLIAEKFVCLLTTKAELCQCSLETFRKNVKTHYSPCDFPLCPKFKLALEGQRFDDIIIKQ
jgi:hypothetical protein